MARCPSAQRRPLPSRFAGTQTEPEPEPSKPAALGMLDSLNSSGSLFSLYHKGRSRGLGRSLGFATCHFGLALGTVFLLDGAGFLSPVLGAQGCPACPECEHPSIEGSGDFLAVVPVPGRSAPPVLKLKFAQGGEDMITHDAARIPVQSPWLTSRRLTEEAAADDVVHADSNTASEHEDTSSPAHGSTTAHAEESAVHVEPNSSAAHGSGIGHIGHAGHPTDALLFMFNAIVIGTMIMHITTLPKFAGLQSTVVLFAMGVAYSLLQEGLGIKEQLGILGRSYSMWMGIDPHLLLYTMLPVLLAGDAMSIDTAVARRVANQCIYLAGPGMLINSFATAAFLYWYLPYEWSFMLSLTLGSILAATDPVAVVNLLKELGASPTLTIQIQGESLLNDGTAIVLYTIAYDILKGESYDSSEICIFLVRTALCAVGLGWIIGWIFVFWIRAANKRLEHHSGIIQISLTLCCAYWSFIIAEAVLSISGVLCTVAASLVLADKMWPQIVDKTTMHACWHMFEYLGNTLIFFLAGALTGNVMVHIGIMDYVHLFVIYIMCTIIRCSLLFASRPILKFLSPDRRSVSRADAVIMTWGGLRGAVGLALAIQVQVDRAGGEISVADANRVLFYTGGIAAMTLMINATTCPALVRFLGITQPTQSKQRMLLALHSQLVDQAATEVSEVPVRQVVGLMLREIHTHIHAAYTKPPDTDHEKPELTSSMVAKMRASARQSVTIVKDNVRNFLLLQAMNMPSGEDLIGAWSSAKDIYDHLPKSRLRVLSDIPDIPLTEQQAEIQRLARDGFVDFSSQRSVNEAFLSLVRSQYWHFIDDGEFIEGTNHAEVLLNSISFAFRSAASGLSDFGFLMTALAEQESMARRSSASTTRPSAFRQVVPGESEDTYGTHDDSDDEAEDQHRKSSFDMRRVQSYFSKKKESVFSEESSRLQVFLNGIINSTHFHGIMMVAIGFNVVNILVEDNFRSDENDQHLVWLVLELVFTSIFTIEFMLKVCALRIRFFCDGWNLFDFVLVALGIFGIIIEFQARESDIVDDDNLSSQARIIRVNRVFRVMRIVRAFRLIRFIQVLKARINGEDLSWELAEQLRSITLLTTFARAHVRSQQQFLRFFGKNGRTQTCEEARCILESQTLVFKAIHVAVKEASKVEDVILHGVNILRESNRVAEKLTKFVLAAHSDGVVSSREAESILDPLRDHRRVWSFQLQQTHSGVQHSASVDMASIPELGGSNSLSDFDDWATSSGTPTAICPVSKPTILDVCGEDVQAEDETTPKKTSPRQPRSSSNVLPLPAGAAPLDFAPPGGFQTKEVATPF